MSKKVPNPSLLADLGQKIATDGQLREKFRTAVDVDRVVVLANEAGFEISAEQVLAFFSARRAELTDADLDMVAGGMGMADGGAGASCFWTCSNNSRRLC